MKRILYIMIVLACACTEPDHKERKAVRELLSRWETVEIVSFGEVDSVCAAVDDNGKWLPHREVHAENPDRKAIYTTMRFHDEDNDTILSYYMVLSEDGDSITHGLQENPFSFWTW